MERRFHGNCANNAVIYVALGLSYVRHFRLSSHCIFVCLVAGFFAYLVFGFIVCLVVGI